MDWPLEYYAKWNKLVKKTTNTVWSHLTEHFHKASQCSNYFPAILFKFFRVSTGKLNLTQEAYLKTQGDKLKDPLKTKPITK